MKEAHALEKMTIVEIGPPFRHDDSLLKRAANQYRSENTSDGRLHFFRSCEWRGIKCYLNNKNMLNN